MNELIYYQGEDGQFYQVAEPVDVKIDLRSLPVGTLIRAYAPQGFVIEIMETSSTMVRTRTVPESVVLSNG